MPYKLDPLGELHINLPNGTVITEIGDLEMPDLETEPDDHDSAPIFKSDASFETELYMSRRSKRRLLRLAKARKMERIRKRYEREKRKVLRMQKKEKREEGEHMNERCGDCEYYRMDDDGEEWFCGNEDSDKYASLITYDDCCENFEKIKWPGGDKDGTETMR